MPIQNDILMQLMEMLRRNQFRRPPGANDGGFQPGDQGYASPMPFDGQARQGFGRMGGRPEEFGPGRLFGGGNGMAPSMGQRDAPMPTNGNWTSGAGWQQQELTPEQLQRQRDARPMPMPQVIGGDFGIPGDSWGPPQLEGGFMPQMGQRAPGLAGLLNAFRRPKGRGGW